MVAALSVRADVSEVTALLASVGGRLHPAIAKACLKGAQFATGEIRKTLYAETDGRGGLARSFRERLVDDGKVIGAESFSELVYARIQEDGGIIRAKGRKLAIPLKSANIAPGKWPRHFPRTGPGSLRLIVTGGGKALLAKRGTNNDGPLQFVLKDQVTIKPLRYVARTAARIADDVNAIVSGAIDDALRVAR